MTEREQIEAVLSRHRGALTQSAIDDIADQLAALLGKARRDGYDGGYASARDFYTKQVEWLAAEREMYVSAYDQLSVEIAGSRNLGLDYLLQMVRSR
jgi:hypothetical protein